MPLHRIKSASGSLYLDPLSVVCVASGQAHQTAIFLAGNVNIMTAGDATKIAAEIAALRGDPEIDTGSRNEFKPEYGPGGNGLHLPFKPRDPKP